MGVSAVEWVGVHSLPFVVLGEDIEVLEGGVWHCLFGVAERAVRM